MREIAGIVGGFGLGLASFAVGGGLIRAEPSGGERAAESGAAVAVALAPSAAAGQAPASLDDRWDDDSSLPAHAERVASYTLVARLDPKAHEVEATGTIRWTNTSRVPQQELWLHLYLNAFKNERTLYMRTPGSGFRGGGTLADWGSISVVRLRARELEADLWPPADAPIDPLGDETDVRVPLPRAVAPGESLTLEVAFRAHLPSISLRTGHFEAFHMVAQWFPKLARLEADGRWAHFPFTRFSEFYADFGAYDVTVDVPAGFVVGATGRRTSFASGGGREVSRFVQDDVHDFAFAAWDGFREKATTVDGVQLRCLYPAGYDRAADVEIEAARFGLGHLGAAYGRYPYETLTIVHPPDGADEAGGMEYPTLITTGGPWYLPWTPVRFLELITVHELAHQWFYGLVATDEHRSPFLDEGLTSYAESEAMEAWYPGSSAGELLGLRVGVPATYRIGGLSALHDGTVARGADEFATGSEYGSLVYGRTATLLTTLGRTFGPERLRRALGRYARSQRFAHPGPEALLAALRESIGPEAEAVARAVLFDGAWVDYRVDSFASSRPSRPAGIFGDPTSPSAAPAPRGGNRWFGDVLVRRRGTLALPVEVELTATDGSVQRVAWDAGQPFARLPYEGSAALASAAVDPNHAALLSSDLLDDAKGGGGVVAPRVLELGGFVAAALIHAAAP